MKVRPIGRLLGAAIVTVAGSLGTFIILVRMLRPGFESREQGAVILWTVPLAVLVVGLAALLHRTGARWQPWVRILVIASLGFALAAAYAIAGYFLSGGWILAFDAPVLYCWAVGAIAGMLVALAPVRRGSSARKAAV